jgi:hypothetical protein
VLISYVSM